MNLSALDGLNACQFSPLIQESAPPRTVNHLVGHGFDDDGRISGNDFLEADGRITRVLIRKNIVTAGDLDDLVEKSASSHRHERREAVRVAQREQHFYLRAGRRSGRDRLKLRADVVYQPFRLGTSIQQIAQLANRSVEVVERLDPVVVDLNAMVDREAANRLARRPPASQYDEIRVKCEDGFKIGIAESADFGQGFEVSWKSAEPADTDEAIRRSERADDFGRVGGQRNNTNGALARTRLFRDRRRSRQPDQCNGGDPAERRGFEDQEASSRALPRP